jgi:DNA-binding MarR family transcriptional regulator
MRREELQNQLFEQNRAMHHAWRMHFAKLPQVVSMPQFGLLMCIKSKQPVSGKNVAEFMGVTRSAVTQLLDALSTEGFVVRTPDEQDRRVHYISLTEKGTAYLEKVEKESKDFFVRATNVLSDKELETYIGLQAKIIDAALVE